MKLSFDKEMDEALRRHARRASDSTLPAQDGAHMDADEISAYAENALPAATRLRYAAHLADCAHCRRLVISGTLAANVAGELEQQATAQSAPGRALPASWRERVAVLFSARALRYAAPALALILVGTVAFIALRQNQTPESAPLVTERREQAGQMPPGNAPAANQSMGSAAPVPATTATPDLSARESGEQTSANSATGGRVATTNAQPPDGLMARRVEETRADTGAQSAPQATPAPSIANEAATRAEAPARQTAELTVRSPAQAANSNAAVARPPAASQPARVREGELAAQSRDDARRNAPPPPPPAAAPAAPGAGIAADASAGPEERASQSRRGAAARAASPRVLAQREEDQGRRETAETRRAGGRTFRRQGNAWVDTAYRSSLSTISMSRNSEQYRALIADEPALGRIVQQLGGEVVIVWRGRAYRIR